MDIQLLGTIKIKEMDNLYVTSNKSYKWGFVLTEAELRRIIDLVTEQMNKVVEPDKYKIDFRILFENGIVAKTTNLDEIINQENSGSLKIVSLTIDTELHNENSGETEEVDRKKDDYRVFIRIENVDSETSSNKNSLYYHVKGKSRDWVMISSSIMEERFTKIKKKKIQIKNVLLILIILLTIGGGASVGFNSNNTETISELETKYDQILHDFSLDSINHIEAIIQIEKAKFEDTANELEGLYAFFFIIIISFGFIVFWENISLRFDKINPNYNFCWGDYLNEYEKKSNFINQIIWGVIIALILSTLGGLIANYFGKI